MEKLIKVRVSAGAKTEKVEELADGSYKIRVSEPAEKGKANLRVTELLAEHFHIPKFRVHLLGGATFREKIYSVEI